eukprot:112293_1
MKLMYSLTEKLDLYYGIKAIDLRTYNKYRGVCDDVAEELKEEYMAEARAEGIEDKQRTGKPTIIGVDGSFNTMGFQALLGQTAAILKTDKIDPVTNRNSKVVANSSRCKGIDHFESSGKIETYGMQDCLVTCHEGGMPVDRMTKDQDTPAAKALNETNIKLNTKTAKDTDMNHGIKGLVGKGLDSQKKGGKVKWKIMKKADSTFTHKQSKKHKGILYRRTSYIFQTRKKSIQKSPELLTNQFRDGSRAEMTALLIHTCYHSSDPDVGDHDICRTAPYNKYTCLYCKATPGQKYVSQNYLDKNGKPSSYPCDKGYFDVMNNYFMDWMDNDTLDALFMAWTGNLNECFNGTFPAFNAAYAGGFLPSAFVIIIKILSALSLPTFTNTCANIYC